MNAASIIWVFIGSGLGGVFRFLISWYFRQNLPSAFPWGTLAINILACGLAGWIYSKNLQTSVLNTPVSLILLVGFCGGFSTFSTFGLETWQLMEKGHLIQAIGYILASIFLGIAAFACFQR